MASGISSVDPNSPSLKKSFRVVIRSDCLLIAISIFSQYGRRFFSKVLTARFFSYLSQRVVYIWTNFSIAKYFNYKKKKLFLESAQYLYFNC